MKKIFLITILFNLLINGVFCGTLTGRVNFDGTPPKNKTLRMDADPVCGSSHKVPVYRESFILNKEGYLKNVLVYIKLIL